MRTYSSIAALQWALPQAWSPASSGKFSPENPARGQCSVTALVGGDILTTETVDGTHFYNRIDGERHDLTVSQFAAPIRFDDMLATRDAAFADTSAMQYRALRKRLGLDRDR